MSHLVIVGWALVASVLGGSQGRSSSWKALVDTTDIHIATITVLVYKAVIELDRAGPVVSFSLAPDTTHLTFDQTAKRLASLAKPVDCAARRDGSNLALTCKPIEDTELLRVRARFLALTLPSLSNQMRASKNGTPGRNLIEFRAGSDRLVLSVEEYDRWKSDYSLSSQHAIGGYPPPANYKDGRIGMIMDVSDASGVDVQIHRH